MNNTSNNMTSPTSNAVSMMNTSAKSIMDLFRGDDKYIAGFLLTLANLIGFLTYFRKAKYNKRTTYFVLLLIIIIATILH